MPEYWNSALEVAVGLSPEELIGAVFSALALSFATVGLYSVTRKKASDRFLLLIGLLILANVLCMALSAGYLQGRDRSRRLEDGPFNGVVFGGLPPASTPPYGFPSSDQVPQASGPWESPPPGSSVVQFFQAADADGNARRSPKEAAAYVLGGHGGTVDMDDFASALWNRTGSSRPLPDPDEPEWQVDRY